MSKKKLIFINRYCWPDESATSRILSDLVSALDRLGWDITVLTSRQSYTDAKTYLKKDDRYEGVVIQRLWSTRCGRQNTLGRLLDYLTFYGASVWALCKHVDAGSIVIAKTDPPLIGVLAACIARWKGAKAVQWCQDLFPEIAMMSFHRRYYSCLKLFLRLRNWSLKQAQAVVVLGSDMKTYLAKQLSSSEKIHVIPNWSGISGAKPISPENTAYRQSVKSDTFVIAYSGNLGRAHHYTTLVKAASLLANESDLQFLITGGGAKYKELQKEVEGVDSRFIFKPYAPRENLVDSLSVADVHWVSLDPCFKDYVFPSKLYGVFAVGRPCLFIGDIDSSLACEIESQEIGYTIAQGDAESLAEKILYLKQNRDHCIRMGQNAREYTEKHLGLEASVKYWGRLLTEL